MWRKSTKCDTNKCLEIEWKKSSRSGSSNGACVETRLACCDTHLAASGTVQVRDSKLLDQNGNYRGPILSFNSNDWRAFLPFVKSF